jgi:hypothetical protein
LLASDLHRHQIGDGLPTPEIEARPSAAECRRRLRHIRARSSVAVTLSTARDADGRYTGDACDLQIDLFTCRDPGGHAKPWRVSRISGATSTNLEVAIAGGAVLNDASINPARRLTGCPLGCPAAMSPESSNIATDGHPETVATPFTPNGVDVAFRVHGDDLAACDRSAVRNADPIVERCHKRVHRRRETPRSGIADVPATRIVSSTKCVTWQIACGSDTSPFVPNDPS